MAIWLNKGEKDGTQASCGCDSSSDIPNLPEFAEKHHLKVGSDCMCIKPTGVYMMCSDGKWELLGKT